MLGKAILPAPPIVLADWSVAWQVSVEVLPTAALSSAPLPPPAPLPDAAPPAVDVAGVAPLDAGVPPAPVDAPVPPPAEPVVAAADWDAAHGPAPADQPQVWALHPGDLPQQPAAADSALPPAPAPAPDPLAPLSGITVPGPAYDIANQAVSGDLPLPEGVPHLASPENLPPGTTVDPSQLGGAESPNVTYLKDIWHAIQTQEISGKDALLALTQRPLTSTGPMGGPAPLAPVAPPAPGAAPAPDAAAPAPGVAPAPGPAAPAPAPILPPA